MPPLQFRNLLHGFVHHACQILFRHYRLFRLVIVEISNDDFFISLFCLLPASFQLRLLDNFLYRFKRPQAFDYHVHGFSLFRK